MKQIIHMKEAVLKITNGSEVKCFLIDELLLNVESTYVIKCAAMHM